MRALPYTGYALDVYSVFPVGYIMAGDNPMLNSGYFLSVLMPVDLFRANLFLFTVVKVLGLQFQACCSCGVNGIRSFPQEHWRKDSGTNR
jgi:hypothetical protein